MVRSRKCVQMVNKFLDQVAAAGGNARLIKKARTQLRYAVRAIEILEHEWDIMDTEIVALHGRLLESHRGVRPVEAQDSRGVSRTRRSR
jgi:hypothetical protein